MPGYNTPYPRAFEIEGYMLHSYKMRNLVFFSLLMIFAITYFSSNLSLYLDVVHKCVSLCDDEVSSETPSAAIPNSSIQKQAYFKGTGDNTAGLRAL